MQTQAQVHRQVCDGFLLKWLFAAGLAWLEFNKEYVNQMNVFPVPDGDTGTNMFLTLRKTFDEVAQLGDETHAGRVAQAAARGALMGARGNSGVILSQLLRGFASGVEGLPAFNPEQFVAASQSAVKAAYTAVEKPVEGTILTVAREAVEGMAARGADAEASLRDVLEALVTAGRDSLNNTPNLLPVLKKAGVVDSGGAGFMFIMEGMLRFLRGEPVQATETQTTAQNWQDALEPDDEEGYGYDVQFLIRGQGLNVERVRADISAMGWSTLVVGDPALIKVHVHVHNPAEPINYAIATLGASIDDVVVENMQLQYEGYVQERTAREDTSSNHRVVDGVAVVTVVPGEGLKRLFLDDLQAAYVVPGGQTMNPSTEDFLAAIDAVPNQDIIILPNNKNIIMAANQAAGMARDKQVRVVPSRTVPQGISAMMPYLGASGSGATVDEVAEQMRDGLHQVVTCEVTTATRSVELDGVEVEAGQFIGLTDGKLTAAGNDLTEVVRQLLGGCCAGDRELVTLYYGADVTRADADALVTALEGAFDGLEFEVVEGGQPLYPYLISVE